MANGTIHGHEIMRLIHGADRPMTRADLEREVAARFGPEARFHTCAREHMTLAELLEFLQHRGKVVEVDGYLRTDIGMMCDHE